MMFPAASLWTLLALSISITGSPVEVRNSRITLPMTTRLHFSNDTNPVQRDGPQHISVPLDNSYVVDNFYLVSCVIIGVGGNPTSYRLVVNTAIAITWIGAATPYRPTGTAIDTQLQMEETYFSTYFSGTLYADTVWITNELTINKMAIGAATDLTREYYMPYDGVLGIGPQTLSRGTILMRPEAMLYTVTERLFRQGSISRSLVGLFFKPSIMNSDHDDGWLIFGSENPGFNIGDIAYTPLTHTGDASVYWGINQTIKYAHIWILRLTTGIVDSGTTFIWITADAYDRYKSVTGADLDPSTGMLSISLDQYNNLRPLEFHIGGQIYNLCPNAQIWPRWLNHKIGGAEGAIYLVIKRLNRFTANKQEIHFRLGYVFLQRFYSVYDVHLSRVGFATTPYTDAITN
ncbi:acid protease [Suillus spraguei]|nr:acid protease [Suillus spraguei]